MIFQGKIIQKVGYLQEFFEKKKFSKKAGFCLQPKIKIPSPDTQKKFNYPKVI
jgi:hypothetical protein